MKVLLTGGAGYIGSHAAVTLLEQGHDVVIVDNFSNSSNDVLEKIHKITKRSVVFYYGDVCNYEVMDCIFTEQEIDVVIHFAGYKAVGESVAKPMMYYKNNLNSTLVLCEVMRKHGCKKIVFSSSATVYGSPESLPIKEDFPLSTTNPYGSSKLFIEQMLRDIYVSDPDFSIAILRYFNPIGAHESGLIGENPNGIPNNLMPYIVAVANKELKELSIFGNDYDTPDGTGVRDYIHVVDLANAHVKACLKVMSTTGVDAYNIGTGIGYSVLDLVKTFSRVNNIEVPYKIVARRKGDIAMCYADASYALEQLGFKASKTVEDMCLDAYNYIKTNK